MIKNYGRKIFHSRNNLKGTGAIRYSFVVLSLLITLLSFINIVHGETIQPLWESDINGINKVSISSDGQYIAVGSYDKYVYLFDNYGNLLWKYYIGNEVTTISISSDGNNIAAGAFNPYIYFFDQEGNNVWKYKTHGALINAVSFSEDGQYIAVGGYPVYLFNKSGFLEWENKLTPIEISAWAYSVSLSSDGQYIAVSGEYGIVNFFDRNGNLVWDYLNPYYHFYSVSISNDGQYIAAGSEDSNIYFFDGDGNLIWNKITGSCPRQVSISNDGEHIAVGGGSYYSHGNISFFDNSGNKLWDYPTDAMVNSVSISNSGQYIVAGSADNNVYLFDKSGTLIWKYNTGPVYSVDISGDETYVAVGAFNRVYLFSTNQQLVASSIVFAITPNSRLVQVGTPVTIFMSVINAGTGNATDVSIAQASTLPATVSYQPWDGATLTGSPDTPVDILAGEAAHFVLTINATAEFDSSPMTFDVSGTNAAAAPISSVNTLTMSASAVPYADIIMMSTSLDMGMTVNTAAAFAIATSNVGSADATGVSLIVDVPSTITGLAYQVNETNPDGSIKGPAAGLTIPVGGQPTFAVFLTPTQAIDYDPANNRIVLKLVDGSGKVVGAQSVAVSSVVA